MYSRLYSNSASNMSYQDTEKLLELLKNHETAHQVTTKQMVKVLAHEFNVPLKTVLKTPYFENKILEFIYSHAKHPNRMRKKIQGTLESSCWFTEETNFPNCFFLVLNGVNKDLRNKLAKIYKAANGNHGADIYENWDVYSNKEYKNSMIFIKSLFFKKALPLILEHESQLEPESEHKHHTRSCPIL